MLSKYDIEEIIEALPDKNGVSSNPKIYQYWLEYQKTLPRDMFVGVLDDLNLETSSEAPINQKIHYAYTTLVANYLRKTSS